MAVLEQAVDFALGLAGNGMLMTQREFDRGDFDDAWNYELVNGVLIVTPLPFRGEVDPNDEIGFLLRNYRRNHPMGRALDLTLPEQHVRTKTSRRRADRLIWANLGRTPRKNEKPSIVIEIVSRRRRDRRRDYETKRDEYAAIGVKEYWLFDRFARTLTVFSGRGKGKPQVIRENQVYQTPLLPGFELPLNDLLARADLWSDEGSDTESEC